MAEQLIRAVPMPEAAACEAAILLRYFATDTAMRVHLGFLDQKHLVTVNRALDLAQILFPLPPPAAT